MMDVCNIVVVVAVIDPLLGKCIDHAENAAASNATMHRTGDLNVHDLASTAWAFGTVAQMDKALFEALAKEAEWHVEAVKAFMPDTPVCASLCINEDSDVHGIPTGECGVRLARAGADVVGINCHFDPFRCLAATKKMVKAVREAGFDKVHFMIQPLAYMTPDASVQGFIDLPEFPFALEPRVCTRFEMARYAREAYNAGIRFIGGCCGFEPYHIRALSEELSKERGGYLPTGCINWGKCLEKHTKPWVRARASRSYWENLNPGTGRPYSTSLSKCDAWEITRGHELVEQHEEETSREELDKGLAFKRRVKQGAC